MLTFPVPAASQGSQVAIGENGRKGQGKGKGGNNSVKNILRKLIPVIVDHDRQLGLLTDRCTMVCILKDEDANMPDYARQTITRKMKDKEL